MDTHKWEGDRSRHGRQPETRIPILDLELYRGFPGACPLRLSGKGAAANAVAKDSTGDTPRAHRRTAEKGFAVHCGVLCATTQGLGRQMFERHAVAPGRSLLNGKVLQRGAEHCE